MRKLESEGEKVGRWEHWQHVYCVQAQKEFKKQNKKPRILQTVQKKRIAEWIVKLKYRKLRTNSQYIYIYTRARARAWWKYLLCHHSY